MAAILNPVIKSHNWPGLGVLEAGQDDLVRGKVKSRPYSQDSRKEKEPADTGSHWFKSVTWGWPINEKEGLIPSFMHKEGGQQAAICRPGLTHHLFCKHSFIKTHPTQFASVLVKSAFMFKSKLSSFNRPNGSRS